MPLIAEESGTTAGGGGWVFGCHSLKSVGRETRKRRGNCGKRPLPSHIPGEHAPITCGPEGCRARETCASVRCRVRPPTVQGSDTEQL